MFINTIPGFLYFSSCISHETIFCTITFLIIQLTLQHTRCGRTEHERFDPRMFIAIYRIKMFIILSCYSFLFLSHDNRCTYTKYPSIIVTSFFFRSWRLVDESGILCTAKYRQSLIIHWTRDTQNWFFYLASLSSQKHH